MMLNGFGNLIQVVQHHGIVERSSGTTQDHGVGPPESNDQSHLASSQKPPGINDTVEQHRIMVLSFC
jgi:hypothetical protein